MNSFLQAAGAVGILGGAILTLHLVLSKFVWSPVKKALVEEIKSEFECRLEPILNWCRSWKPMAALIWLIESLGWKNASRVW
jgi:hypothetical protein